jgi:DNA-binding HxlR family transcriptional regulator
MTTSTSADNGALLRDVLARIGDKWPVIVICRLDGQPRLDRRPPHRHPSLAVSPSTLVDTSLMGR